MVFTLALLFSFRPAMASDGAETAGDVLRWLIPGVAFGTTFHLNDSEGRKQFYKGFASNLGVTYGLKWAISKERPNGEDDDSFPSGHTSMAFQGAAFIHRRYGLKYAVPAYVGSAFVAWSRVDSDNHDTVDVLAGAAVGIASSFLFTRSYQGVVVTPVASGNYYGVEVGFQW